MQTICIVNESENAALQKSNRVLAKYLTQIGSRTYLGTISEEGVQDLQKELIEHRSRHMSVIAFLVKKNHATSILFTVGNTRSFDLEKGIYAFRERSVPYTLPSFKKSSFFKLTEALLRVSALFHDLGKYNDAFQAKLDNAMRGKQASTREFIRHDAMSFFYLLSLSASILQVPSDSTPILYLSKMDSEVFKRLCHGLCSPEINSIHHLKVLEEWNGISYENFQQLFETSINKLLETLNSASTVANHSITPNGYYYLLILMLVLTHHKLTENYEHADSLPKNAEDNYVNSFRGYFKAFENLTAASEEQKELYQKVIRFSKGIAFSDTQYCNRLQDLFDTIQSSEISLDLETRAQLAMITMHFARPLLIMSDHLGSIQKTDPKPSKGTYLSENIAIANTVVHKGPKSTVVYPGDSVLTHLKSVSNYTRKTSSLALSAIQQKHDTDLFPRAPLHKIEKLNDMLIFPSSERFAWQQEAFDYIRQMELNSQKFVAVIAETGSGKTIASAKILAAMQPAKNPSLRYTYALGLRSLTLQTGKSYQQDLGFNDKQLAILLGDAVQKKLALHKSTETNLQAFNQSDITGSESLELSEAFDAIATAHTQVEGRWYEYLENKKSEFSLAHEFSKNVMSLVDTPVVVCTVDQIIDVSYLSRISKARLFLRLMNSDLVLDEVDNYSLEQLPAICRLIYLSALYGNSVVCMSATLSPFILQALVHAFNEGRRAGNLLKPAELHSTGELVQVSNIYRPHSIKLPNSKLPSSYTKEVVVELDASPVWNAIVNYNKAVVDIMATREPLKVLHTMPFSLYATRTEFYNSLLDQVAILHNAQKQKVQFENKDGTFDKEVSIGFVKFNAVAEARRFARYLLESPLTLPPDTEVSVLCYHSKFSNFELQQIDGILNTLVNRKNLQNEFISSNAKRLLQPFAEHIPQKNWIVIIATTSILETGRDHDYDWCVIEPSSTRSLVQTAGRVYRHRPLTTSINSICMMASTVNNLIHNSTQHASTEQSEISTNKKDSKRAPLASHAGILVHIKELPMTTQMKPFVKKMLSAIDSTTALGTQSQDSVSSANVLTVLMTNKQLQESLPLTATEECIIAQKMLSGRVGKNQEGASLYFDQNMVFSSYAYRDRFRSSKQDLQLSILSSVPLNSKIELKEIKIRNLEGNRTTAGEASLEIGIEKFTTHASVRNLRALDPLYTSLEHDREQSAKQTLSELRKILSAEECISLFNYNLQIYNTTSNAEHLGYYHPLLGFDNKPTDLDSE